ncbi:MAG: hypothetical protein LBU45_07920 [Azoarcus sp.]|nr:hypothetical protein [Azoarcus sp.]
MSDIADIAQRKIEMIAAADLAKRKPRGPEPIGACHYCGEPLQPGRRWCDADCRDDWENEQQMKAQNG